MMRPRVVIADDHAMVREGLVRLLEGDVDVVGTVGDGRAVVTEVIRLHPDVAVLDIGMPLLNGIEAARQIREAAPEVRLIFLTQQTGKEYAQAAFAAGARAYVVKNAAAAELLEAVREVMSGRYFVSPELRQKYPGVEASSSEPFGSALTPRQREVLQLIAEGKTAKEMAQVLGISAKTVEFHKAGVMDALGLRTTAELTRYAMEHGFVQV
jgi:DNA-binding NarL/FixJ family response regulator